MGGLRWKSGTRSGGEPSGSPGSQDPRALDGGGDGRPRNGKGPEYPDDGIRGAPGWLNPFALEAARDRRLAAAKSGRSSTNLSGQAGTRPYVNTFLGGTR